MTTYTVNNEDDAIRVFQLLQYRFGWAGNIFTRADAAAAWAERADEYGEPTDMSDSDWAFVQRTHDWSRSMTDSLHEVLANNLRDAVNDGMLAACRAERINQSTNSN